MVTRRSSKKAPRRTAIAYLRVSTEDQDLGLDAQRAGIDAWAAREGVQVVAWHEERVSGGAELDERPALMRALSDVAARRAAILVVHRLDRLARHVLTVEIVAQELARRKAALACVVGGGSGDGEADPTGELIRTVLAGVGRFERRMIGARTRAALAVKRERGDALGRPGRERYGFRREGKALVEEPIEQATIARARELYAVEGVSVRAVIAALAAEGRVNRAGEPFGVRAMWEMLKGDVR